ncbi:MAG: protein kinase, partial [Planctomycetes bacterium]|nr:protein kinase [Planctomycetota bacterium]
TITGSLLGTPHYMSPEQCRGEAARTGSDIYALGITLFHMLVGHPPYSGLHSTEEIIAEHLKGQRLEPEKLRRSIPKQVAELVRKMTRSDPDARPSAKELTEVLAKFTPAQLEGEKGVRGRGGRRTARPAGKSMTPIFLLGGVLLLGLVVVLAMGGRDEPEPPAPPPKPAPVAEKPAEKPDRPPVDRTLEQELRDLIRDAVREEGTGNYMEAYGIYNQVKLKAKTDHPLYQQADAAAKMLMERINAEKGNREGRERKVFITASESERAGAEYDERREEFATLQRSFQVSVVRAEMDKLLARTREATPERARIEAGMGRLAYLESLMGMVEGRGGTLTGGREYWSKYFPDAGMDDVILAPTRRASASARRRSRGRRSFPGRASRTRWSSASWTRCGPPRARRNASGWPISARSSTTRRRRPISISSCSWTIVRRWRRRSGPCAGSS